MNALAGAQKGILEQAIKTAEGTAGDQAPGPLKMLFPCCGGPVETLKKFECVIPADKKEDFNSLYKTYADSKEKLKNM